MISIFNIIRPVNSRQRKVLAAIFVKPTMASIVFADIESLVKALGGSVLEREGSRVSVQLMGEEWRCHGHTQARKPSVIKLNRHANYLIA